MSVNRCTRLDPQCRKIYDPGAMDLAPSSTRGLREMYISFDWEHSPGAMILGPIEYKECIHGLGVAAASFFVFLTSGCLGLQLPIIALQGLKYLYRVTAWQTVALSL